MTNEFWGKILPEWLTAIGTVGAVISALWLARRDDQIRLRIRAGVRLIVMHGATSPGPGYLTIDVVNLGRRSARINFVGWQTGILFWKRHYWQNPDPGAAAGLSGKLPTELLDGQSTQYFWLLDKWVLENTARMFEGKPIWPWLASRLIFATVQTSTGIVVKRRIEKPLANKIRESLKSSE